MFESHRPFITAVTEVTNEISVEEIEAYLNGHTVPNQEALAKAFEAWTKGNPEAIRQALTEPNEARPEPPREAKPEPPREAKPEPPKKVK